MFQALGETAAETVTVCAAAGAESSNSTSMPFVNATLDAPLLKLAALKSQVVLSAAPFHVRKTEPTETFKNTLLAVEKKALCIWSPAMSPALGPGGRKPPASETLPTEPLPARAALSITLPLLEVEPVTENVPALMVVSPVQVLVPAAVRTPVPV